LWLHDRSQGEVSTAAGASVEPDAFAWGAPAVQPMQAAMAVRQLRRSLGRSMSSWVSDYTTPSCYKRSWGHLALWCAFGWASRCLAVLELRWGHRAVRQQLAKLHGVFVSTVCSGIAAPERALQSIARAARDHLRLDCTMAVVGALDCDRASRAVLAQCVLDALLGGDLLQTLPSPIRAWIKQTRSTAEDLRARLLDDLSGGVASITCQRTGATCTLVVGDLLVAGLPCHDYAPFGKCRRQSGPTLVVILTFVRLVRIRRPARLLLENLTQFCWALLAQDGYLGDLCRHEDATMDPRDMGVPQERTRRYVLWELHDLPAPASPFADVLHVFRLRGHTCIAHDLIERDRAVQPPTRCQRQYITWLQARTGALPPMFAISQDPNFCRRVMLPDGAVPTLMRSSVLYFTPNSQIL